MVFSSTEFIVFFLPSVLIAYYLCSFSLRLQNFILLVFSLGFYAYGEPKYIFLMIGSVLVNYILGLLIDRFREHYGKVILIIACILNIGVLFYVKYLDFFIRSINELWEGLSLKEYNIPLPIGISFFTFQALSYIIDLYRGNVKVQKNPFYLGLYIAFFPQLIAGPIVRYESIEEDILNRKVNFTAFSAGVSRFIIGVSKKVLISNSMAVIVDEIFAFQDIPVSLAWLGSIAYTMQIYYDFSGYSDMAIGLGHMFGFRFMENFNYPYISKSITEFWRRWHISLGHWFRDYVYFPLGGSRVKNKDRILINLLVVWLLTGIWHGAEWTFIIWGLLNYICIAFEKVFSFDKWDIKPVYKHIYALFIINLSWVIFRSPDLIKAGQYIGSMFGLYGNGFWSDYTFMFIKENIVQFLAAFIFSVPISRKFNKFLVEKKKYYKTFEFFYPLVMMLLFYISLCYLYKNVYNPFIYFNF